MNVSLSELFGRWVVRAAGAFMVTVAILAGAKIGMMLIDRIDLLPGLTRSVAPYQSR